MSAKKILLLDWDASVGGRGKNLSFLAAGLSERGWQVELCALKPPSTIGIELERKKIPVKTIHWAVGGIWGFMSRRGKLRELSDLIKEGGYDLVHTFESEANATGRRAARGTGVPIVSSLRLPLTIGGRRRRSMERKTRSNCRRVIINAEALRETARSFGFKDAMIRLVPDGLEPEAFFEECKPRREDFGMATNNFVFLFAGHFEERKGLDLLISAFDRLHNENGCVRLLLAGSGPLAGDLEREIARRNLTDSIKVVGLRRDMPNLYATCDAVVLPSRAEGLPNSLIEAMAALRPVIAASVGGVNDLVKEGETGWLIPPNHEEALLTTMRAAAANPDENRRMAERALKKVRESFSVEELLDETEKVYSEVLDEAGV